MLNQVNTPGPVPPSARTKETRPVRLATITTAQGPRLHVRGRSGYIDVAGGTGDPRMSELAYVLAAGEPAMSAIHRLESQDGREIAPADFAAAVPAPPRVLCLGLNYSEHALEGGRAVPTWPDAFVRGADSVLAPYADLVKPALTSRFDYEAELGIVIGSGGRYVRAEDALDAIAGFVVLNDASCRDWQRAATQWTAGKNFVGSMPIGPELVTTDEVAVGAHLADARQRPGRRGVLLLVHPPGSGRCHRHRHAGRRRLRPDATGVDGARRRDRGHRREGGHHPQPHRRRKGRSRRLALAARR